MNASSRRPRRPYPGLVASAEVRRSLLIGSLVPPRLLSLRCCHRRQPSDLILGQTVFSRHGLALNKTGVRPPQNSHARCASRSLRHPSAKQLANFAQQPIKLHRLGIELVTSGRECLLALAGKRMGRQADDRHVPRLGVALQAPCRFPAVDDRHLQVHQDKVRPLGSRNLASFFAILGDQHFELIGELKPHLEHVTAVLVVFDVENTEHGSPSLEHLSSTTSTHHANRAELLDPRVQFWKPRAHLELMMSMAATVIFWTADLRVTASTRIGARLLPRRGKSRPRRAGVLRTAGRGADAIDQRNGNPPYLVAARRWGGRNFRRGHLR